MDDLLRILVEIGRFLPGRREFLAGQ